MGRVREKSVVMELDGQAVPVTVRRHPRAKRLILRLDDTGAGAVVTVPTYADIADGLDMVRRKSAWLKRQLAKAPKRIAFADGISVPVLDDVHVIRHRPDARRGVWAEDGHLHVSGNPEHLARRVTDWFRAEARRRIVPLADEKAEALGVKRGRISIRDTRSRWGSCAVGGNLSFSWRLVMAPELVLDYVVAHEVAHIAHHHHGPAFWDAVAGLTPNTEQGRAWLTAFGAGLHVYGT